MQIWLRILDEDVDEGRLVAHLFVLFGEARTEGAILAPRVLLVHCVHFYCFLIKGAMQTHGVLGF